MTTRRPARRPARPAAAPRRVIGYLRVSTDKQADSGLSLDAQRSKVEGYAALYGLELVDVLTDAGASAKSLDRPALADALARLDAGEADALLVAKLDRLTRSVRDLADLTDACQRGGWALLSVADQLDTDSAAGRLVLNILVSVGQWEREAIGERTAAAMQVKAARGEYTGGATPYGWRLSDDGVNLTPEPSEQAAAALARTLHGEGLSLRAVGAALAARGVFPRAGRWYATTVKAVIAAREAA